MAKFRDKLGREWTVEITVAHIGILKKDLGIDLRDVLKSRGASLAEALSDPEKFGCVTWLLCREQAEKLIEDPDSFGFLFNGEAAREASLAIQEAAWDFYHGPKTAERIRLGLRAVHTEMDQAIADRVEETTKEVGQGVRDYLTSKLSAGNTPASSVSIPVP